jgi:hypothetical protein
LCLRGTLRPKNLIVPNPLKGDTAGKQCWQTVLCIEIVSRFLLQNVFRLNRNNIDAVFEYREMSTVRKSDFAPFGPGTCCSFLEKPEGFQNEHLPEAITHLSLKMNIE